MNFCAVTGEIKDNLQWKEDRSLEDSTEEETSPRAVLEAPIVGIDSERSCSSVYSSSSAEKSLEDLSLFREPQRLHWKNVFDVWKKKSIKRFTTIPLHYEISWSLRKKLSRIRSAEDTFDCGESVSKPSWRSFEYAELAAATENFSQHRLIGKGGNAEVYRGFLADGQAVAVKRLLKEEKEEDERAADFLSELGIIAHITHPKAARLLGFSVECGLHLVLQLAPHGSLASVLHCQGEILAWSIRFKVAVGVAEGLQYLHHECKRRIIHRDIKASNILLADDYTPQISDFGLAKWLPQRWAHHIIFPIEGTFGYLSPEYFMRGIVNEKTDVFAYGVLLLELITGRHAVDSLGQSLVMWAKPLLDRNAVEALVDPRICSDYDFGELERTTLAASMCIRHVSTCRPEMIRVVQILRGEDRGDLKQKGLEAKAVTADYSDLDDYTGTAYLSDLNRHKQLVME